MRAMGGSGVFMGSESGFRGLYWLTGECLRGGRGARVRLQLRPSGGRRSRLVRRRDANEATAAKREDVRAKSRATPDTIDWGGESRNLPCRKKECDRAVEI